MRKSVIDKKIKAFKEVFTNWKQSKRTDSIYARVNERKTERVIKYHARNLTKGVFDKFGTEDKFETTGCDVVYLISPRGKLMYSLGHGGRSWRNTSLKHVREYNGRQGTSKRVQAEKEDGLTYWDETWIPTELQIKDVFFIGKKYEWMKDYPELWDFKFFMSFNSLKDAKNFLGFTYISNSRFYGMFKGKLADTFDDILTYRDNNNIVNLFNKLDSETYHMFVDYVNMCKQSGVEPEIPKGYNKLRKLHDEIAEKQNQDLLEYTSKEVVVFPQDVKYERVWKERGLKFKRLTDPYSLRLTGIRQKHCIGSYYQHVFTMGVYSFLEGGKEYNLAFDSGSGMVSQFKGYRNHNAPKELHKKVTEGIDLKHTIVRKTELPEHYPYIIPQKEIGKRNQERYQLQQAVGFEGDPHGDLPF